MSGSDIIETIQPLINAFTALSIPYHIGGSVASSAFGKARSTLDVDIVAQVSAHVVAPLVARLEGVYYVSLESIEEAVARHASFNIIHLETMLKVDVFVLKDRAYDIQAFERRIADAIEADEPAKTFFLASPEDIILNKLEWFRLGGETSERQWDDVLGVLMVQEGALDMEYLGRWARELSIEDLLTKAVAEARENCRI